MENSKEKMTSSVKEPQEKREKMTGNGQNITDGFGEGNSKEDGTSCVKQPQEISMDLSTTQEKDHTGVVWQYNKWTLLTQNTVLKVFDRETVWHMILKQIWLVSAD